MASLKTMFNRNPLAETRLGHERIFLCEFPALAGLLAHMVSKPNHCGKKIWQSRVTKVAKPCRAFG